VTQPLKAETLYAAIARLAPEEVAARETAEAPSRHQTPTRPVDSAVGLRETRPGLARPPADMRVAAIGTDLTRFPRAAHLTSWAGGAPGQSDRAGKRAAGKTRTGHRCWRTILVQSADAAARTNGSDLRAQDRRLAARCGKPRRRLAVAPSMLVLASAMLQRQEPDRAAGADVVDRL
jgi:transposase